MAKQVQRTSPSGYVTTYTQLQDSIWFVQESNGDFDFYTKARNGRFVQEFYRKDKTIYKMYAKKAEKILNEMA